MGTDPAALALEVELLEARLAEELGGGLRGWWRSGADAPPPPGPCATAPATAAVLARARALPGDDGLRADALWRLCVGAAVARRTAGLRAEAGRPAAARALAAEASARGFVDGWALARALAGEPATLGWSGGADPSRPAGTADGEGAGVGVGVVPWPDAAPAPDHEAADGVAPTAPAVPGACTGDAAASPHRLAEGDAAAQAALEPARRTEALGRLARALGVDPAPIRLELRDGPAATPGRTFVLDPGRDVRVRVWRRPGAPARGTLRVVLHELGHALLAAGWGGLPWALATAPSRAVDEGVATWTAARLAHPGFLRDVLRLPTAAADAVAADERRTLPARAAAARARAAAERAAWAAGGPLPDAPQGAADPGGSGSYAAAHDVAAALDARLGDGWPTGALPRLRAGGAQQGWLAPWVARG